MYSRFMPMIPSASTPRPRESSSVAKESNKIPNTYQDPRSRRFVALGLATAVIVFGCLSANVTWADDPSTLEHSDDDAGGVPLDRTGPSIEKGMTEWGLLGGFGDAHHIFDGAVPEQFIQAGARIGRVLTDPIGPGMLNGNLELSLEVLPLFVLFQGETVYGASATLLFRHYIAPAHQVRPFLSFGAGTLVSTQQVPEGTSRLNFTPQIGFGLAWQTGAKYFFAEYRLHHISNAATAELNPGINSSCVQFGVSWFR